MRASAALRHAVEDGFVWPDALAAIKTKASIVNVQRKITTMRASGFFNSWGKTA